MGIWVVLEAMLNVSIALVAYVAGMIAGYNWPAAVLCTFPLGIVSLVGSIPFRGTSKYTIPARMAGFFFTALTLGASVVIWALKLPI